MGECFLYGQKGEIKLPKYGNEPGQISTFELFMMGFNPMYNGGGN